MSKKECALNDEQLINKSFEIVKKLCDTGGKSWTLRVPVDFNTDPDIIFIELGNRLKKRTAMLEKILNVESTAFGLKGFDVVRFKNEIQDALGV